MKSSPIHSNTDRTKLEGTDNNPATIGLLGLGLTILLFNLYNAQLFPLDNLIFSMGMTYGGIGMVIVGLMEKRERNFFSATIFFSFGLFWLSVVAFFIQTNPTPPPGETLAMSTFFILWGLFTSLLFLNSIHRNRALQFVFFSLALFLFLLSAAIATGDTTIKLTSEWAGILCGLATIYTGIAQTINETYNRSIIPLGVMNK